jgi:Flp pilus assembly protein CpaB
MQKKKAMKPKRLRRSSAKLYALYGSIGMIAALFLLLFSRPERVESNPAPSREVIVAKDHDMVLVPTPVRAVARGEKISEVQFAETKWPKSRVSSKYINNLENYKDAVALVSLPAHLPIPVSALQFSRTDENAVVDGIPEGMRAITVKVDAEAAVEGWARSGNYVDVIVLRASRDEESGIEAKVIAENVRILSAGQSAEPLSTKSQAPRAPQTVTLLVNQEDALKVKTASSLGKLAFSLRGSGDDSPTVATVMNQKTLLGGAKRSSPLKERYRGMAKGPDGKTYVLGGDSRWVRTLQAETSTELPDGGQSAKLTLTASANEAGSALKDNR